MNTIVGRRLAINGCATCSLAEARMYLEHITRTEYSDERARRQDLEVTRSRWQWPPRAVAPCRPLQQLSAPQQPG
jgi:hypothetical protein